MKLVINGGKTTENPTVQDVSDAVESIKDQSNAFVILERVPGEVMQVLHTEGSFLLEYIEGSEQYECGENLPVDRVADLLTQYLQSNNSWRTVVTWKKKHSNPITEITRGFIPNLFAKIGIYSQNGILIFFVLLFSVFITLGLLCGIILQGDSIGAAPIFILFDMVLLGILIRDNRRHKRKWETRE